MLEPLPTDRVRKNKGRSKMHTLIEPRGTILTYVTVTTGKVDDVRILAVLKSTAFDVLFG